MVGVWFENCPYPNILKVQTSDKKRRKNYHSTTNSGSYAVLIQYMPCISQFPRSIWSLFEPGMHVPNTQITKYPTILIQTITAPTGQSFKIEGEKKESGGKNKNSDWTMM